MRDVEKIYHVLYGIHSKIPICCVKAFINEKTTKAKNWGYLPCKSCHRKKNKIKLHYCTGLCWKIQATIARMVFGPVKWFGRTIVPYLDRYYIASHDQSQK